MLSNLGGSQRNLLQLLQRNKDGRTVDEIAGDLRLSCTTVRQHLASLESSGYVRRAPPRKTAGRPGYVFALSPQGSELFPRQYSWFTSLVLGSLARQHGPHGLGEYLRGLAKALAASLSNSEGNVPPRLRLATLTDTMNQLGYDAELSELDAGHAEVRAYNCVYHHLAKEHPQVCE